MTKENNISKSKKSWADSFKKVNTSPINTSQDEENTDKNDDEVDEETTPNISNGGKITKLEEENADLKDKLLRTLAELENTRRIATEEKEKMAKFAITNIVKDLTTIMDIFYRAIDDAKDKEKDGPFKSFYDGIEMTFNEFKKVFDKNNIERLYPIGEKFDPNLHEAIANVEKEGVESGTVIEVMQPGYTLNKRVIKPAVVAVAK